MECSFRSVAEWREARKTRAFVTQEAREMSKKMESKWVPPDEGMLEGKILSFPTPATVFEAKAIGVREALSWIWSLQLQVPEILLESDSLLTVQGVNNASANCLEVGDVIESCRLQLQHMRRVSIRFIRKQATRVAHNLA